MTTLAKLHEHAEELRNRLVLKTSPLAIKMLPQEKDIPEGAVRPKRDLGYHLATCQGFAMSRREGKLMAMLKEDIWCSEGAIGFGAGEPPQEFLNGYTRYPASAKSLEVGAIWVREFPRLPANKYVGVASAPLATASFVPDVVVIYCDTAQLQTLLISRAYEVGSELKCAISAKGACVFSVVPSILSGECQVTVPCPGDMAYAMAQSDEMIFTMPTGKMEMVMEGMRNAGKHGYTIHRRFTFMPREPFIRDSYHKVGKMIGMEQPEVK